MFWLKIYHQIYTHSLCYEFYNKNSQIPCVCNIRQVPWGATIIVVSLFYFFDEYYSIINKFLELSDFVTVKVASVYCSLHNYCMN